jgi:hypothetical protein
VVERLTIDKIRFFRVERTYAVRTGKWYFEFEAVTTGEMRVGWARPSVHADTELGADELAYVFNGNKVSRPLSVASTLLSKHTLNLNVYMLNSLVWVRLDHPD